jgi:hypothetical protein
MPASRVTISGRKFSLAVTSITGVSDASSNSWLFLIPIPTGPAMVQKDLPFFESMGLTDLRFLRVEEGLVEWIILQMLARGDLIGCGKVISRLRPYSLVEAGSRDAHWNLLARALAQVFRGKRK